MKVYGPEFESLYGFRSVPAPAVNYASLREAREAYESFVRACDRWGQTPAPVWLFCGQYEREEGIRIDFDTYPDYPDYIMEVGPRGGIRLMAA